MIYRESSEMRASLEPSVEELIVDGLEAIGGEIHPQESMSYGVSDSAHHVFFGHLNQRTVAIKPYWGLSDVYRAEHERQMLVSASEVGIDTLSPIGVFSGDLGKYLVTDYIPGLASMNQVGWEQSQNSSILTKYHLPLLQQMGKFLGKIHGNELVHGDLQLKNFAQRRTGRFVLIDLEKSTLTHRMSDCEKGEARESDISRLYSSLARKNFLSGFASSIVREVFESHFITEYTRVLTAHEQEGVHIDK